MKIAPNWLDKAIGQIDPQRALERVRARAMLSSLTDGGSYVGGDTSRRSMRFWAARNTSADAATLPVLNKLRANTRDLARNNPLAGGAINSVVTAVVGTGLAPEPQILAGRLKLTEEQANAWQQEAKEIFGLWAENPLWCDITATQTFWEKQDLVFRSSLESGDCFALLPMLKHAGEPFATKLQVIEADRACNPGQKSDTIEWAGGLRCNEYGRPLQVAIANKHPGDVLAAGLQWSVYDFIGAKTGRRNVLHVTTQLRPGQRRGVPYLAPVIESLKQLGDYTEAEITAAVISGAFSVFIESENNANNSAGYDMGVATAGPGQIAGNEAYIAPGAIVDLMPGEKVTTANPGRPNAAFDPFVQAILRQIGVSLELPFEVLVKHFTASYSAARAALLDAWRFYKKRRQWLSWQFCQPVYEAVIWEAVATGRISAPGFLNDPMIRACYLRCLWVGDAPGAIDPLKEAEAAEKRVNIGISTLAKESIAFDGSNWEDNHKQRAREFAARKEAGLEVAAPVAAPANPAPSKPDAPPEDATDLEQE